MPAPSSPSTFQRPDLGQAYEEFDLMAHVQGLVGLTVMPMTSVALQSASFSKVLIEALLNDGRDVKRAPGAGYQRQAWQFTQDSYATEERGVEEILDDRERAAYGYTGIRFEQLASDRAVSAVLRDLEIEIQGIVQDSGTYTSAGVTVEWNTLATATPVNDVLTARETFKAQLGIYPNTIVMSEKVMTNAVQTAEVQDYVKYGGAPGLDPTQMGSAAMSQVWRIPNVVVSQSVRNSANPGATASIADIWDDEFVSLLHVPQGDDLRAMGFGRTFAFEDLVIEQYRDERVRSDVIRARLDVDVKVIHSEAIYILSNITT